MTQPVPFGQLVIKRQGPVPLGLFVRSVSYPFMDPELSVFYFYYFSCAPLALDLLSALIHSRSGLGFILFHSPSSFYSPVPFLSFSFYGFGFWFWFFDLT